MSYYSHKVTGGKLIKVKVDSKDESILDITILGDFFLHPEHVLEEIEVSLIGVRLSEDTITERLISVLEKNHAKLIGASARDFANAIMAAWMASDHNS